MNNIFVSYDLYKAGQDYPAIAKTIQSLGSAIKVQKSLWYIKSTKTAQQAADILKQSIDNNDSLIVIDASSNSAAWYGLSNLVTDFIQINWNK